MDLLEHTLPESAARRRTARELADAFREADERYVRDRRPEVFRS